MSGGNSWLRYLNKLQITAFQGKCACFAVLGLYLRFWITFLWFFSFDHCSLFYIFSGPFFSIRDSIVSQKKEHSLLFLSNLFDQSSTEGHLSKHWHCYRRSWISVSGVYQNWAGVGVLLGTTFNLRTPAENVNGRERRVDACVKIQ